MILTHLGGSLNYMTQSQCFKYEELFSEINGQIIMTIPPGILREYNWTVGDSIKIDVVDRSLILSRITDE